MRLGIGFNQMWSGSDMNTYFSVMVAPCNHCTNADGRFNTTYLHCHSFVDTCSGLYLGTACACSGLGKPVGEVVVSNQTHSWLSYLMWLTVYQCMIKKFADGCANNYFCDYYNLHVVS